jgi:hypothetical protein
MINKSLLVITLIVVGAMFGALLGFWTTVALIACLLILRSAKRYWKEKPIETEPVAQPA